jgi:hypothetical protein
MQVVEKKSTNKISGMIAADLNSGWGIVQVAKKYNVARADILKMSEADRALKDVIDRRFKDILKFAGNKAGKSNPTAAAEITQLWSEIDELGIREGLHPNTGAAKLRVALEKHKSRPDLSED